MDRRSWRHLCQLEIHQCESVVERGPQLAGLRGREVALRLQHQERGGEAHIEPGIFGLKPPGRQFPCDDGRLHLLLSALRTRSPARVMSAATCSSSVWMRLSTCAMSAARRPPSLATAGGRAFAERALGPAAVRRRPPAPAVGAAHALAGPRDVGRYLQFQRLDAAVNLRHVSRASPAFAGHGRW